MESNPTRDTFKLANRQIVYFYSDNLIGLDLAYPSGRVSADM